MGCAVYRRVAEASTTLALLTLLGCAARAPAKSQLCTPPRLPQSSLTFGPGGEADEIRGRVISHRTLEFVPGAIVTIPSLRVRVLSDSTGRFRISGIPHGDYEFFIHADVPGQGSVRATVTFEGATNVVAVLALNMNVDFACSRPARAPVIK